MPRHAILILALFVAAATGLAVAVPKAEEPPAPTVAEAAEAPEPPPLTRAERTALGEVTLPDTELHSLDSEETGVRYRLYVSLPEGYHERQERFPVVYLLDADYSFAIARNVVEHLADRDHLRELILVAVAYEDESRYRWDRTRDYTPKYWPTGGYSDGQQELSGGGPKFLRFLEHELVPWTDRTFRTLPAERGIVGHSYGGLFVAWATLTRPGLFPHAVAVSPSLWYAERYLLAYEAARAEELSDLPVRLYLVVGARENRRMATDLEELAEALGRHGYRGLAVESRILPDETHNSVFPAALSFGLRWAYRGR